MLTIHSSRTCFVPAKGGTEKRAPFASTTHVGLIQVLGDKAINQGDVMQKTISLFGYLVAAAASLGLFSIHHLLASNPTLLAFQACAVFLMLWARVTFGLRSFHPIANTTQGGLVTTGPYRYWRHPIYASIIYFVWAGQVQAPTTLSIALALAVTIGLAARMILEEQFLSTAYPAYSEYMRHAKRIVPFVF